ncbi:hypothetical protein xavtCFBP7764_22230 [Xanthomonas citri]|nr:hypothetical protein xavtCFBP7764_22230 [Xanthomonas citri]
MCQHGAFLFAQQQKDHFSTKNKSNSAWARRDLSHVITFWFRKLPTPYCPARFLCDRFAERIDNGGGPGHWGSRHRDGFGTTASAVLLTGREFDV